MATFLVSCAADGHAQCAKVHDELAKCPMQRLNRGTWLVSTTCTAEDLIERLAVLLSPDEHLFVAVVSAAAAWCGYNDTQSAEIDAILRG